MQRTPRNLPFLLLLTVLAALLVGACATNRPASQQIDDAAITGKVKAKLAADPELNPFEIDVDTIDGAVRLSGSVEEPGDRWEAEKLARDTRGVRSVENDIRIGDPTVAENIEDGVILAKIKTKLAADPQINPLNVEVDVKGGEVTLRGKVKNRQRKAEIEKHVWSTDGVRAVRNRIDVG